MAVNMNQAGFDRRITRVKQVLQDQGLEASHVSPLGYDDKNKSPLRKYLYKVDLATPALASTFPGTQPGTCKAPPEGVSVLIVNLVNPAANGANNANRVENEVAAQQLVREWLAENGDHSLQVVPDVYVWAAAATGDAVDENGFGWIMSEFRDGEILEVPFTELEYTEPVLEQIKDIYTAIRMADLPEGVTKFGGGLKFNSDGQIVDGEAPFKHPVKPADSYLEWRVSHLRAQIGKATESPVLLGWERNGVAARIEAFLTGGGPEKLLADVNIHEQTLIHCDLTTEKFLWDPQEREITAVLGFDFAHVSHTYDEFLHRSFEDIGGSVKYPTTLEILTGDFIETEDNRDEKEWWLAKDWNDVLGGLAPSEIDGADGIYDLLRLQGLLCPDGLSKDDYHDTYMSNPIDRKEKLRAAAEAALLKWLEAHGF